MTIAAAHLSLAGSANAQTDKTDTTNVFSYLRRNPPSCLTAARADTKVLTDTIV